MKRCEKRRERLPESTRLPKTDAFERTLTLCRGVVFAPESPRSSAKANGSKTTNTH